MKRVTLADVLVELNACSEARAWLAAQPPARDADTSAHADTYASRCAIAEMHVQCADAVRAHISWPDVDRRLYVRCDVRCGGGGVL